MQPHYWWQRKPWQWIAALWGVMGLLVADITSKAWMVTPTGWGNSTAVIPGVLAWTPVHNEGIAWSLFHGEMHWIVVLTSGILVGLLAWFHTQATMPRRVWLGFVFTLGGAFGNWLERLMTGRVTDFIDIQLIHYPIFNLADCFVCVGVALLCWHYATSPART